MKQVKIFSTTSHCEELGKEMNDWITKQNNLINITDIQIKPVANSQSVFSYYMGYIVYEIEPVLNDEKIKDLFNRAVSYVS